MRTYYVYQDAETGFWHCMRDCSAAFGPGSVMSVGTIYQDAASAEKAAEEHTTLGVRIVHAKPPTQRRHVTLRKMSGWDR